MSKYVVKLLDGEPCLYIETTWTPPTFFADETPIPRIEHQLIGKVSKDSEFEIGETYIHRDVTIVDSTTKYDIYKNPIKENVYRIKKWTSR